MSSKSSEETIRILTSNGDEIIFPTHLIVYCDKLSRIFRPSTVESDDESSEENDHDASTPSTVTRGTSDDVRRVEEFLVKISRGKLLEKEFLGNLSKEKMKGMLVVSEDFGIKILSTLLCTTFVERSSALDTIYEFLDMDTKNLKDVERAAFKTAMTSGIKIPESCLDAWPILSTTPSSIYSKWKELNTINTQKQVQVKKTNGLVFESETLTLISQSGDEFVASTKIACDLSAHLRHFVNLSDRDSDNEDSDVEDINGTLQNIKLTTSTSNVLQCFLNYIKMYEKNGAPSATRVADWESSFLLTINNEKLGELLNGIEFLGIKPLLLLLATKLSNKTLSQTYKILNKAQSDDIGSLDEASYATCQVSGIPMSEKSFSKWPLNFVRPVEIYWKLNGKKRSAS